MKIRLKSQVVALCLAGGILLPMVTTAASSSDDTKLAAEVAKLQQQVNSLQARLATKQAITKMQARHRMNRKKSSAKQAAVASATDQSTADQPTDVGTDLTSPDSGLPGNDYLPFDLDVPGRAFVSTGPYIGVPLQFAGSNLIVNSPSVNTDTQLLTLRTNINRQLNLMNGPIDYQLRHSHLLLSGVVEAQANYTNWGGAPSTSNIDVTNVALDAFFMGPSNWTLGFIEFNFDGNPPFSSPYGSASASNYTVSNSRVFINKAFITIGNFNKTPFYGTVGQYYVPFGVYSSVSISDMLSKSLGRTKARAIELGMLQQQKDAFYAAIYGFRGDAHAASVSKVNNGGINVGYKFKTDLVSGDFGAGVIADIADSVGMQLGTGFQSYEQLSHRVPAYDLHGSLSLSYNIDILMEMVAASTSFNPNDMSYNGNGAKPWAFDVQAAYSFKPYDRPSSIGIGYGRSHQALAMGLPTGRFLIVLNTSIWRNTLQSLELRRDRNYAASSTANGPIGAAATPGACTADACTANGKATNAVTAQFDYYF